MQADSHSGNGGLGDRRRLRVTYVYAQPRLESLPEIEAGRAPDSALLGQRHLGEFGLEADIHDPFFWRRRGQWRGKKRVAQMAAWGRELLLPIELPPTDVVCTPLVQLFPLVDRMRHHEVCLLNNGLRGILTRSSPRKKRMITASMRASSAIVCASAAERERLVAVSGLNPDRFQTALIGIDDSFWAPDGGDEGDYVLSVGFDHARDYRTFAAAMSQLPHRAILVCRRRALEGISLPPNVEVQPDASFVELRELYARARSVVIPIRHKDYPYGADISGLTVLLEAMAMGKPIIMSEQWGLDEYVEDGRSARIVPAEDPARLREVIDEVHVDRALRQRLGEGGRLRIEERLTSRHYAGQLAEIIRSSVRA